MDSITIQKAAWQRILLPFLQEQMDVSEIIKKASRQRDLSATLNHNCPCENSSSPKK